MIWMFEMPLKEEKNNDLTTLSIEENFNIYVALDYKNIFMERLSESSSIAIDLSLVTEIDSSAIQLLLLLNREANANNKRVELINPSIPVSGILDLYGLTDEFNISTTILNT